MKQAWVGVVLFAWSAFASSRGEEVSVCVKGLPVDWKMLHMGKRVASRVMTHAGVELRWGICGRAGGGVQIEFRDEAPADLAQTATAFALPYEGRTIVIFADRLERQARSYRGEFLGYVMAHEITHLLQGQPRHSARGVMKAHWSPEDRRKIVTEELQFAEEDVALIQRGMRWRQGLGGGPRGEIPLAARRP